MGGKTASALLRSLHLPTRPRWGLCLGHLRPRTSVPNTGTENASGTAPGLILSPRRRSWGGGQGWVKRTWALIWTRQICLGVCGRQGSQRIRRDHPAKLLVRVTWWGSATSGSGRGASEAGRPDNPVRRAQSAIKCCLGDGVRDLSFLPAFLPALTSPKAPFIPPSPIFFFICRLS